jgi:SpoIID/LytB domain protein
MVSGRGEWRSGLGSGTFAGSLRITRDDGQILLTGPDAESVLAGSRVEVAPTDETHSLAIGDTSYPGTLVIGMNPAGGLFVLNTITCEEFVLGTISAQVFDTAPQEAMRTQAVVLRTRALHELGARHPGEDFDFCAEAGCCWEYGWERPLRQRLIEAVKSTAGQVLCYEGKPILACFDANAGGCTEDIDAAWPGNRPRAYPYLRRVASPTDESGSAATRDYAECWEWKDRVIQPSAIRQRMRESYRMDIGAVTRLEIRSRTTSGRVRELVVTGRQASRLVVGSDRVRTILETASSLLDPDISTIRLTDGAFRVSGRGQGSGVGLSQHGALGMALAGADYDEILGYYYPGVDLVEDFGEGYSRRLSSSITEGAGQSARSLGGPIIRVGLFFGENAPTAVLVLGTGTWRAGQQQGVFGGEVRAEACGNEVVLVSGGRRRVVGDTVNFSPSRDGCCLGLRIPDEDRGPSAFRGDLLLRAQDGNLCVINRLGLEDYVRGVVSNEVFSLGGCEAFKVQAVISRTYALHESRFGHRHPAGIDVCSTGLHCQEYRGQATETSWGDEAVAKTAGEVLTYHGRPILAYYHDNGGGQTELPYHAGWALRASDFPYIASVESPDDKAGLLLKGFEWCYEWGPELDPVIRSFYGDRTVLEPSGIRERLRHFCGEDVGDVLDLVIRERSPSGRVRRLDVVGSRCSFTVNGTDDYVRKVLRTPSSLITSITKVGDEFWVTGRGRAHGVGLSQQGAMGMAIRCKRYDEILQRYYRNVELSSDYATADGDE